MTPQQARAAVADTFPKPFNRTRFLEFTRNLLNKFDETKAAQWNTTYVKAAFKSHVNRFERLGTYTSPDGDKLDVLVVRLADDSKLERARTALRNFVADHLKTRDEKDAALVAFVSPDERQWRFSYVKMEYAAVETETGKIGVETRLTPARRFSYIVGEGESCHTAQSRFLSLLGDTEQSPSLAHLEDAFGVEAVTKEFFNQYAALFGDINAALEKLVDKDKAIGSEFKKKHVSTVDFAKKLMGQIVFLYFLQKKGWLGVEKGKNWGTGSHDFLRRLARGDYGAYDNFFNDILEPLFYDTLATDRGHEAWCKTFKRRIPFLNGGLFEPLGDYDWQKIAILLPNKLFTNSERTDAGEVGTGVLDVFDRYNFTVNEAEPLEQEVAIDPEMLGKVFENLIEENRRKGLGSFYTPREIVHYMCQESLINHLDTAVNQDQGRVPRADLETFVHLGDQISHYEAVETRYAIKMPKGIEQHARLIDEKLADITVCDPAVGSGAFPVGMMTEIVRARSTLTPYFKDVHDRTPYHFKRHAIQSRLYGVDIDPGAVEIAKLRLWLSLVVEEETPTPLPNLDYKIVVGNSLLGFPFRSPRVQKIEKLKADYFDETDHDKKLKLKREIDSELAQAFTASKASLGYQVTFDFQIYFSEVFRENKGFDVVIANPPYVSVEKFARTVVQDVWKRTFKTFAARGDIYCFFYEQGLNLLRPGGVLTFISSNKFQRAGYGKGLRALLSGQQIQTLIDFCELPVFAAATDPMIVIAAKAPPPAGHEFPVLVVKDEAEFSSLPQSVTSRATHYKPEQLKADGWSLEGSAGLALVDKLRGKGTPLGKFVKGQLYLGIRTGLNDAFVIDRATKARLLREDKNSADLIKPWIRGRDIKRWTHEFHDLYVIIARYGFHTKLRQYPAIRHHLAQFEGNLRARGQCQSSRDGSDEGQHHWLELDNNPSESYIAAFETPKIVLADIGKRFKASWSKSGYFIGNTGYIIANAEKSTLAILLSTVTDWYARMTFQGLGDPWRGGLLRFINRNLVTIPIPPTSLEDKSKLTDLAERAEKYANEGDGRALTAVEKKIDDIVYRLFDLSAEEKDHIETSLVNTRQNDSEDENDQEEA